LFQDLGPLGAGQIALAWPGSGESLKSGLAELAWASVTGGCALGLRRESIAETAVCLSPGQSDVAAQQPESPPPNGRDAGQHVEVRHGQD